MTVIKGHRWIEKFSADFLVCILILIIKMTVAKNLKAKKVLRKFIWIPLD